MQYSSLEKSSIVPQIFKKHFNSGHAINNETDSKPGTPPSGSPAQGTKKLICKRILLRKFHHYSTVPKNTQKDTNRTRKLLFP